MADDADPYPKLGSVYRVCGPKSNQSRWNEATTPNSAETGNSRVDSRQPHIMSGGSAPRNWFPHNSISNAWGKPNVIHKLSKPGTGASAGANHNKEVDKSNSSKHIAWGRYASSNHSKFPKKSSVDSKPEEGPYASVGVVSTPSKEFKNGQWKDVIIPQHHSHFGSEISDDENAESDSEIVFDSDDNLSLDDTDSETGERSHEGCKKSKWFRKFFDNLNRLAIEEITSQGKPWHCPACQGGVGAINWYQGLLPLLNHSRTIQSRRARLHRLFAETLEEECRRRNVPLTVASDTYGRWEGLDKKVKDHDIVWPPMVVIMNTRHEQDDNNNMWTGMGNQELLDYFSGYAALKARHSYGPQGHRGMSVLIFETSTAGYLEAVRLHKNFKEQRRDQDAWNRCQNAFVPGGKRQLYGYLASKEDMDNFNRHCSGRSKLKYEMRSYQEMVESKIKHMNDDGHQLSYFKDKAAREQIRSQALAQTLSKVTEKLRLATEENRVVRERATEQHQQQNKEEMDAQEFFFQEQLQIIEQAIAAKEDSFEELQQAKREKVKLSRRDSIENEKVDDKQWVEKISNFIRLQDKEMRQFEAEREYVVKNYLEKKLALQKKQLQEQLEIKKEYENELTQLMDKYSSGQSLDETGLK